MTQPGIMADRGHLVWLLPPMLARGRGQVTRVQE